MKGKVEYDPDQMFAYVSFEHSDLIRRLEASLKSRVGGRKEGQDRYRTGSVKTGLVQRIMQ